MALKIYSTMEPDGDFPAVKAKHVEMDDGTKLQDVLPIIVPITPEGYKALVDEGKDLPGVYYFVSGDAK